MMMHPVVIVSLLMSSVGTAVFAQCEGGREVNPTSVIITKPSIFNMIENSPTCARAIGRLLEIECSRREIVIVDRNPGPTSPNLNSPNDVRRFLTWWRQNRTDFWIAFVTETRMTFTSVELSFLSYPTQHIGLPNIQLFGTANVFFNDVNGGTPINYTFSDVFTPQENTVNNVTLPFLSNPGPLNAVRLQMSFTGVDNIDWFFLSEIRVCTGTTTPPPLPAIQFQSPSDGERVVLDTSSGTPTSVVLNCTVSVAGVFEWRWRKENQILQNGGRFQITTILGTTTSKLTISQPSNTDVGTYTCEVRHRSQSGYQSRRVELVFSVTGPGGTSGTMPTGGTPGTLGTGTTLGTRGSPVTGDMTGGSTEITTAGVPMNGGENGGIIVAAVIIALLVIGIIIVVIVLVVLFLRRRKMTATKTDLRTQNGNGTTNLTVVSTKTKTKTRTKKKAKTSVSGSSQRRYTVDDIEWQIKQPDIYAAVNKEPPPAIPPQNFDMSELYNANYEGHMQPPSRRMTATSQYNGPPKLAKVSDESKLDFSQNPTYQSKEEMDTEQTNASYEPMSNELNIYADPMHGRSLTADNTFRNDEPIYSEPLDPTLLFSQNAGERGGSDLHPYGAIYAEPQPLKKSEAPLEIKTSNIREVKQLGIGEFGEVILAETVGVSLKDFKLSQDDNKKNIHIQVAVKKLKPRAKSSVREAFEKEIKFMSRLKDDNIVRLLAVCSSDSPFIVMEYMENGDLNQYLQKFELATSDSSVILPNQLPASILVYMAVQIASGMCYLASFKYVHRDLATRNCLVGQNFVVKIADFGMSRSLYEDSYYRVRGRAMLPIRWMASESFYGRFSEKTDVWAYGVTMWEIFTFCQHQPYEELDDQEVIQDAVRGTSRQLLPKPEGCSQDIYELMLRCWEYAADERASFKEIFSSLAAIHRRM